MLEIRDRIFDFYPGLPHVCVVCTTENIHRQRAKGIVCDQIKCSVYIEVLQWVNFCVVCTREIGEMCYTYTPLSRITKIKTAKKFMQ